MFVQVTVFFDKSDENVGKIEKFEINAIKPENPIKNPKTASTRYKKVGIFPIKKKMCRLFGIYEK